MQLMEVSRLTSCWKVLIILQCKNLWIAQKVQSACYSKKASGLTLYYIIIHALVILIIWLPLSIIITTLAKNADSEKALFYAVITGAGLHTLIFIYLMIVAHYTRFMIITEDTTKVLKKIWASVKFVSRRFFLAYPLYLLLLANLVLLIFVYKFLSGVVGMTSGFTIFIMFLLQQVFIWSRIWLKIWFYGSQLEYYLYNKE
jgi:hypothetical protein